MLNINVINTIMRKFYMNCYDKAIAEINTIHYVDMTNYFVGISSVDGIPDGNYYRSSIEKIPLKNGTMMTFRYLYDYGGSERYPFVRFNLEGFENFRGLILAHS